MDMCDSRSDGLSCDGDISLVGRSDLAGLLNAIAYDTELIVRFSCFMSEQGLRVLRHLSQTRGQPVYQMTIISDLAGIGSRHLNKGALAMIGNVTKVMMAHYPEMLRKIIFVNTSSFFTAIWSVVSRFLDERTRGKVIFLGSKFKTQLQEHVEASQLPVHLGGSASMTPPIPRSGRIPKALYGGVGVGLTRLPIPRGCRVNSAMTLHLQAGQAAKWRWRVVTGKRIPCVEVVFCCSQGDGGIGNDNGTASRNREFATPLEDSATVLQIFPQGDGGEGCLVAPSHGVLFLRFDNRTSSWSRAVAYSLETKPVPEHEPEVCVQQVPVARVVAMRPSTIKVPSEANTLPMGILYISSSNCVHSDKVLTQFSADQLQLLQISIVDILQLHMDKSPLPARITSVPTLLSIESGDIIRGRSRIRKALKARLQLLLEQSTCNAKMVRGKPSPKMTLGSAFARCATLAALEETDLPHTLQKAEMADSTGTTGKADTKTIQSGHFPRPLVSPIRTINPWFKG